MKRLLIILFYPLSLFSQTIGDSVINIRVIGSVGTIMVQPKNFPLSVATINALLAKQSIIPTGTVLQYLKGDLSLGTFPTTTASFINSTNKNFVTDAQLIVLGNTAGSNNGDNSVNALYSSLISNATHTGDATGATVLTLATVNSNVGSFGSATQTGTFTVNAKGLITAASSITITPAIGSITGFGTGVATALAINTGSAGSFITFNGAGGTPSSLVGTNITGLTATQVGLGNVTNESKATMFTNAAFTGTTTGITATMVGLGSVTNESKSTMFTNAVFTGTFTAPNGTITNIMIANSSITIGSTSISLGGTSTTLAGLTSVTSTTFVGALTGTASGNLVSGGALGTPSSGILTNCTFPTLNQNTTGSAAFLTTGRTINGTSFDGSTNITITAAAGTLTGTTLNSTVITTSITTIGTLIAGAVPTTLLTGTITNAQLAGSIAFSKLVGSDITTIGTLSAGAVPTTLLTGTITNAQLAGLIAYSKLSLTGTILNADLAGSIAASKLVGTDITTVGTITTGTWNGTAITTLGAATGTSFAATGAITSSGTAGIGYATGAGGTVTQATSKSTGATLNKLSGEITLNAAALAAATIVSFTLTNSTIAATDVMILNHVTTGTRGAYTLNAQCAAGSAIIYVRNNTAGSLSEAIVIRYAVIKAVTN